MTLSTNKEKYKVLLAAVLIILSLLAMGLKICVGLDNDEVFIIYLASRVAEGKTLFLDSWDVYVTNAVIPAFFIRIYLDLTHSLDGLMVYLRIISSIVQCLVAYLSYRIFSKHYSRESAFFAAIVIANLLPRATQNLEYGFNAMIFIILTSLLLFDSFQSDGNKEIMVGMAGLSYGLAVFVYPTMLISLPYLLYLLFFRINPSVKIRLKYNLIFWGCCFLLFLLFMYYILTHMTINDFIINVSGLLKGDDHSKFFSAFSNRDSLFKLFFRSTALILCSFLLYLPLRKINHFPPITIVYIYIVLTCLLIIMLNITGLRPSGPFGLLERYIIYAVMAVILAFSFKKDPPLFYCFTIMGFFIYFGALAGSNLGFAENAMYLEPTIISFIISIGEHKLSISKPGISKLASLFIFMMLIELIFSKAYFVRVNGTTPSNVTEYRIVSEEGITKNIFLYPGQICEWKKYREYLQKNTQFGITYINVGSDTLLNYYYNGEMAAPQYAGTLYAGRQWIDYYSLGKRELPDYIYVDIRYYPDITMFLSTPFGQYIKDRYVEQSLEPGAEFYILKKKVL